MTEITLRRATHLRRSIEQSLIQLDTTLNTSTSVPATFNVDQAKTARDTAKKEFNANLADIRNLRRVLFNIRKAVDAKKASTEIDDLIAERTLQVETINTLGQILTGVATFDEPRLVGSLELSLRQSSVAQSSRYALTGGEIPVPLFDRADIDQHRAALAEAKRKITEIDDNVMELNATNRIIVSDEDWQILKRKAIV